MRVLGILKGIGTKLSSIPIFGRRSSTDQETISELEDEAQPGNSGVDPSIFFSRIARRGSSYVRCVFSDVHSVLHCLSVSMLGRAGFCQPADESKKIGEGVCCGCGNVFTLNGDLSETHPRCIACGDDYGLVNADLLAYLRPYSSLRKRDMNLLQLLKGRAMIWKQRQRISEHCFAHFEPGTVVEAMKMSVEEVHAIRSLGEIPSGPS